MSFPDLSRTGKRWLIVAAAAAVIAGAFTAGLIFGPREPLSEVGEVTIEIIREQVFPDPRTTAAGRRAGGGPPLGNYVYLHGAHRYVSLPDDVKLIDKIGLGTCILPPSECPKLPLYTFQRGEAKVALDTMGVMWDAGEGTDFSAFPFFVFEDADGQ
jgi:hypothetical protein